MGFGLLIAGLILTCIASVVVFLLVARKRRDEFDEWF